MRKQTAALLLVLLGLACSGGPRLPPSAPQGGDVVLEVRGGVKGGPYRLGKAEVAALPRRTVEGTDPATGRTATWEGVDLAAVTLRVTLLPGADTLVLRTADGRAVAVPLNLVRQLKPVLADHADGEAIADRVVAWPTSMQGGLLYDPRARAWWARGVGVLELVNGWSLTRAVLVPPGAAPGARLGADLVGGRCLQCHRVRKVGGEKGPDLTRVADRLAFPAFARLLTDHPGWSDTGREPPPDDAAADVYAFLRALASEAATGVVEEPAPPEMQPRQGQRGGAVGGY